WAKDPRCTQKEKKHDRASSWIWEVGGAIFSIISIALLVGFLVYVDGKLYNDWQYSISPNTITSVIATIAKAAMLIPVSSCLSQLKWNASQSPIPMPLYNMEVLDQASCGPFGALEVFWGTKPGLATVGALLMVMSVTVDPFAQQILSLPSRRVQAPNETAYTQSSHVYWPRWKLSSEVEPKMQLAILGGVSQTYSHLAPVCSTGTCEYDDFVTLGVCTECEDITAKTSQNCVSEAPSLSDGFPIAANCTYTSPSGAKFVPSTLRSGSLNKSQFSVTRQPWTSILTSTSQWVGQRTIRSCLSLQQIKVYPCIGASLSCHFIYPCSLAMDNSPSCLHYVIKRASRGHSYIDEATLSSLLKTFLGSPEDSSNQYKKWYEVIQQELDRITIMSTDAEDFNLYLVAGGYDEEGKDTCDFNQASHPEWSEFESELGPANKAIFAMCHLSFSAILSDWWQDVVFDVSQVNERGHNLLTLAARAGCTPICKILIDKGAEVNLQVEGRTYGSALVAAARRGHTETVRCLVEAGADVNMFVQHGFHKTALIAALFAGNSETAKYLVQEAHADVNQTYTPEDEEDDEEDFEPIVLLTPVGLAAKINNLEILELLVKYGANVNVPEQSGNPLAVAIRFGNRQSAKYLIQKAKADVKLPMVESSFVTILERAAADDRNLEIVKCLIEAGAEVNPAEYGSQGTPLGAAAYGNYKSKGGSMIEIVRYLVEAGANIHKGDDEKSPVSLAVAARDIKVLRYLVESGAELDVPKEYKNAVEYGNFSEGIRYLVQKGADVNMRLSGNYGSVLEKTSAEDRTLQVTTALVEAGADVNLISEGGEYGSPLAAAVASWIGADMDTVKYLIQKGADVNLSLPHGRYGNALIAAAARGYNVEAVEYLIRSGADVNASPQHGEYGSALVAAAACDETVDTVKALMEAGADIKRIFEKGEYDCVLAAAVTNVHTQLDIVEAVVAAGADVNQPFKRGKYGSALAAAAYQGNVEIVELLLKSGADVNMHLENGDYRTALAAAEAGEEEETVAILKKHGATA
ncbi:hypothetical protein N7522_002807, partial [Penicillium canescens]